MHHQLEHAYDTRGTQHAGILLYIKMLIRNPEAGYFTSNHPKSINKIKLTWPGNQSHYSESPFMNEQIYWLYKHSSYMYKFKMLIIKNSHQQLEN